MEVITPDWPAPRHVRAAFTLRTGGVSAAPCESLNVGMHVGDSAEAVAENRRRVKASLHLPGEPLWLRQVHGVAVVEVDANASIDAQPEADAAVARIDADTLKASPRAVCAVQVADCMPVLFTARDGSAIGAAHAGWRGLASGVLESTLRRFGMPPSEVLAWMGPAIGVTHFEVGEDVYRSFVSADRGAKDAFVPNARGRWQCDLYALARRRLAALGVNEVYGGGWCTYADAGRFFSFRRDGRCGRMAALIWVDGRD